MENNEISALEQPFRFLFTEHLSFSEKVILIQYETPLVYYYFVLL